MGAENVTLRWIWYNATCVAAIAAIGGAVAGDARLAIAMIGGALFTAAFCTVGRPQ